MISIDIEKRLRAYKGQHLLQIKKEFAAESITKIYGASGAGKTTLLKIIAGFIQPENGSIMVNGATWFSAESKINLPPQQRLCGFVFQDYALFPNMTVQEHLQYATTDVAWIDRLLKLGKLEPFVSHKPIYLSGGQQQRLAILRALAIKPKLLLMDEPFSALDPETKTELITELKLIIAELKATVLIVTHNPQEVAELATDEFKAE
ncbi:MAG TPA: ATP-binding cassette domain-containing protein [Mucilaginibacter sp.]